MLRFQQNCGHSVMDGLWTTSALYVVPHAIPLTVAPTPVSTQRMTPVTTMSLVNPGQANNYLTRLPLVSILFNELCGCVIFLHGAAVLKFAFVYAPLDVAPYCQHIISEFQCGKPNMCSSAIQSPMVCCSHHEPPMGDPARLAPDASKGSAIMSGCWQTPAQQYLHGPSQPVHMCSHCAPSFCIHSHIGDSWAQV